MNMQQMMKQAQKMQKDMMKAQAEIEAMTFVSDTNKMVEVSANGKKEITNIKISEELAEDVEMIQDLVLVAVNNVLKQIEATSNEKMGAFGAGMNGMF